MPSILAPLERSRLKTLSRSVTPGSTKLRIICGTSGIRQKEYFEAFDAEDAAVADAAAFAGGKQLHVACSAAG